MYLLNDKELWV